MQIVRLTSAGLGEAEDGSRWPRVLPQEQIDHEGRVLVPSPDRVKAPCRHFKSCGSCSMQHASDSFVADWKAMVVQRALSARGISAEIETIVTSPAHSRRRAKFSARRTKSGAVVGFHGKSSNAIVEVTECSVITPGLQAAMPALKSLTAIGASRKSELDIFVIESAEGPDVAFSGGPDPDRETMTAMIALARDAGFARLTWNDDVLGTFADPWLAMGPARVVPPPGAFLQATRSGEAALVECVRRATKGASRIVDLFAGCGTFSLPLSESAEIHAVEGDAAMLDALDRAWRQATGVRKVTTEARDLFRRPLLPDELGFDAAVIDPPRAGAEAQISELASASIKTIAMVSCNPVTFARDAAHLIRSGYEIGPVTLVDQFRWSPHVELCATLTIS